MWVVYDTKIFVHRNNLCKVLVDKPVNVTILYWSIRTIDKFLDETTGTVSFQKVTAEFQCPDVEAVDGE